MKTTNTSKLTSVHSVMIFVASLGISYALVSEFFFERPKRELLLVMIGTLVAGIASRKRQQTEQ